MFIKVKSLYLLFQIEKLQLLVFFEETKKLDLYTKLDLSYIRSLDTEKK